MRVECQVRPCVGVTDRVGGHAVAYTGFFSVQMKHFRRTVARRGERTLEQRLERLEDAVQELTDTLRAMQPPAPIPEDADPSGGCRELLDRGVPAGERVAVFADPAALPFEALGRPAVGLAAATAGSAAAVARLEAQRVQGVRFLLVPEAGRPGVEQDALLVEHLVAHFRAIAEEPEVGVVFEVSAHRAVDAEPPALAVVIDGLGLGDRLAPMLDWTSLGLARVYCRAGPSSGLSSPMPASSHISTTRSRWCSSTTPRAWTRRHASPPARSCG